MLVILLIPGIAFAEEVNIPAVEYDISQWEKLWQELPMEIKGLSGGLSPKLLIESYREGAQGLFDGEALKDVVVDCFRQAIRGMGSLIGMALLAGVGDVLTGGREGIGDMLGFCITGLCVSMVTGTVYSQFTQVVEAVEKMAKVTEVTSPVMMTLIAACGSAKSAGMQPWAILLCNSITDVFKSVLMPLIPVMCGFTAASCITGHRQLRPMAKLIKSVLKWGMGLAFTIFLGSVSIRGLNASGMDRAGAKAIKYAFDKSVPVVGGMISGTYDGLLAGAVVLKNAAGTAAVLLLVFTVAYPALNIMSTIMALRLTGAFCGLLSDDRISGIIEGAAEGCTYMFAVCVTVALMNLIVVAASLVASGI